MPVITEKPSRVLSGIKLYDTDKIAKILNMSVHTIRRYFREGKFPKVRVNGRYYISEQNFLKYLTTGKIDLEESQIIKKEVIKRTERNLDVIYKKLNNMKLMVDMLEKSKGYSNVFLEVAKYEEKYEKLKKELEKYKKKPINES